MKKILASFSSVIAMITLIISFSACASGNAGGGSGNSAGVLKFRHVDGGMSVVGFAGDSKDVKEIVIPSTSEGLPVIAIDPHAFEDCTNLTSVIIPDSVKSIGEGAFRECNSLTSVIIPDSVKNIDEDAFYGCRGLMSITIGSGVESIGKCAFSGYAGETGDCYKLVEVTNKSNLDIQKGSMDNGGVAYYALKVKTGGESKIVNRDGFMFYTDENGTNYLLSYMGTETKLTLPNDYNGQSYEIHDCAFRGCSNLTSVIIPDSVTSIGYRAFYDCDSLTSAIIPDSVKSIGEDAFYGCRGLMSITIGSGVESVGGGAFGGCHKLVEVINKSNLDIQKGSIGNGYVAYYALKVKTSVESEIVNRDGFMFYTDENGTNYLLSYMGTETELTLPNDYNGQSYEIHDYAFESCSSLTSVIISDSVTSIGDHAFYDCHNLMSVTIGSGVKSIEEYAFSVCYKLVEVINKSILSISKGSKYPGYVACYAIEVKTGGESKIVNLDGFMFYTDEKDVNYLLGYAGIETELTLPNDYNGQSYEIHDCAFRGCSSLTSVIIPDSVTSIGESAFYKCSSLMSVIIPDSVTSIGNEVFCYCYSLTSAIIPDSVTSIGNSAFYACYDLMSVTIGSGVKSIGYNAFESCSSLTSVIIPDSVTSIGSRAFYNCRSLMSITIGSGVESIGREAFGGHERGVDICRKLVEVINKSNLDIRKGSSYNGGVAYCAIEVKTGGESKIVNRDGFMFYTDENGTNYLFGYTGTETKLTLPNDYNGQSYEIHDYAFSGCSSLTSVIIPDSVTSIGDSAFYKCSSLTSVIIPDSVTSIGDSAFYKCSSLMSVIIPDSVTSIGSATFLYCHSLTSVTFKNPYGWKISLPTWMGGGDISDISNNSLSDASTAAIYLKSTYTGYYWTRS